MQPRSRKQKPWIPVVLAGGLLLSAALWLLGPDSAAALPKAQFVPLDEPEVWILSGYHNKVYQSFIPLKDFPRSRPGHNSSRGIQVPDTDIGIVLQEQDSPSGLLTWEITVNSECFTIPDWRDTGKREEVICRGPYWSVKVVRYKERWL